jgi:hypothetical protein
MEIKFISNDAEFVHSLASSASAFSTTARGHEWEFEIGNPEYVPGAIESWWEFLGTIGVLSFPLSVVGNLIASWIWQGLRRDTVEPAPKVLPPTVVKLVVRDNDRCVDVRIESSNLEVIRETVQAALKHVHQRD